MSVGELAQTLKALRIPSYLYDINILRKGMADECVCLRKQDDTWSVFTSERGQKFDIKQYKSESDACKETLRLILLVFKYL